MSHSQSQEIFNVIPLNMVFAIGLFVDKLYQIKVTFSFYFDESLYHKLVLDFIRYFCMVIIISPLYFVTFGKLG